MLHPEDEDTVILWSNRKCLLSATAPHPRRLTSVTLAVWEPRIFNSPCTYPHLCLDSLHADVHKLWSCDADSPLAVCDIFPTVQSWCWQVSKSAVLLCGPFVTCSDEIEWMHMVDKSASPLSCYCADHCQPSQTLPFIKWVALFLCFMDWDTLSVIGYVLCFYIVIVFYYK